MPDRRKSIFISGGAAGIGRAVAERFAAAGWFVGIYDVDVEAAVSAADALGRERCSAGKLDVREATEWRLALEHFVAEAGGLDVLLNNAGVMTTGDFTTIPLVKYDRMVEINLLGTIYGAYEAFGHLAKTPGARLINMCSASAIFGQPDMAVYSSTKFAVRGFTEALAIEWRAAKIAVCAIWPLYVDTALVRGADRTRNMDSLGVRLTASDVAKVVYRAATVSPRSLKRHWLVGRQTHLSALGAKLSPHRLTDVVVRRLAGR